MSDELEEQWMGFYWKDKKDQVVTATQYLMDRFLRVFRSSFSREEGTYLNLMKAHSLNLGRALQWR
jgi:hypothetical protein